MKMNMTRTRSILMKLITLRPKKGIVGVNSSNTQLEAHMKLQQLQITLRLFYTENSFPSEREVALRNISPTSNLHPSLYKLLHSLSQIQVQAKQAWWSGSEHKKAFQTPTMWHKVSRIKNFTYQRFLLKTKCRHLARFHKCQSQALKIGKVCQSWVSTKKSHL